jgi:DNA-binding NarL/FixJ family response regulator
MTRDLRFSAGHGSQERTPPEDPACEQLHLEGCGVDWTGDRLDRRDDITRRRRARVVVHDRTPSTRQELEAALEDTDFEVAREAPVLTYADDPEPTVVIIALREAEDWSTLERIGTSPARAVALLEPNGHPHLLPWSCRRALALGASAAVAADAPTEVIVSTVWATIAGLAVFPASLIPRPPVDDTSPADCISAQELEWLRMLVTRETVADLAKLAAWSERTMHRRLASLYRRLGVRGRQEAVLWLERAGLGTDHSNQAN